MKVNVIYDDGTGVTKEAQIEIEGLKPGDKWFWVEGLTGYILRLEKVTYALDPKNQIGEVS